MHAYRRGYWKWLSKEEGEGGRGRGRVRGAVGPKDVSLPVCHKSSVLLCDRLADRASSVSSGTPGYCYTVTVFYLFIFLRRGSCLLKQRRKRGTPPVWCLGADTQLSHVRLLVSVWSSLWPAFEGRKNKATIIYHDTEDLGEERQQKWLTGWIHTAASVQKQPATFV